MPELTYLEAVRQALHDEMEIDERVFVMGEDVGKQGGAFGATKELQQRFGEARSIDTPVAESGIVGVAIGAAMAGQRPVAEMQFADFVSCAYDQLITCAAKMHYRIGWAVPLVVRCPNGGGVGGGPYHSENVEAWFHHHAGLKIACPATAKDAYGLLRSAIRDPNPVVFCEHKFLYRRVKEDVQTGVNDGVLVPLGKAAVLRPGEDLSIVTYASTTQLSLAVADRLAAEGVSVEVIDLRTLVPFDRETVLESVRRTGKVLIVHEDNLTGGFGGEIAAVVAEEAFEYLDAPVRRVAALDTPVPFAPPLEREYLPLEDDIFKAARELAGIPSFGRGCLAADRDLRIGSYNQTTREASAGPSRIPAWSERAVSPQAVDGAGGAGGHTAGRRGARDPGHSRPIGGHRDRRPPRRGGVRRLHGLQRSA